MSQTLTETLIEPNTTYHLDSSIDQRASIGIVKPQSTKSIPVIRVRESATGGSEFVDDEIPLDVFHALGDLSSKIDVAALQFRFVPSQLMRLDVGTLKQAFPRWHSYLIFTNSHYGDLAKPHNAPARQFVITLNGTCLLTVIDKSVDGTTQRGESRLLKTGDLLFVEDLDGTGHYACNGSDTSERFSLFLPVADGQMVFGRSG